MPQPIEGVSQAEVLLLLRAAIDTAIRYPTKPNETVALAIAEHHPRAMRSAHLIHNLGQRRWAWLEEHGYTDAVAV